MIFDDQQLANKLHKLITKKIQKRNIYYMQYNKGVRFLLFVLDIYNKYTLVVQVKGKKGITISNEFKNFLAESSCHSNKIRQILAVHYAIDY